MSQKKATRTCDHCGRDVNIQYSRCPLCGGDLEEVAAFIDPQCPRCGVPLQIHIKDGEEYDICIECGGLWLDSNEFHLATRESDIIKKENFKKKFVKGPVKDHGGYIHCVRCGKMMNRKNFGRISGVMIDKCSKHGVWLDAGELEKIRHFIADGGMDRTRDREIMKHKDELRALASNVKDVAFTQRLIHFWNPKRWLFRSW